MSQVYYATLKERSLGEHAVEAMEELCARAGELGYAKITSQYARTDTIRNNLARAFCQITQDPNDFLVMLDYDHKHPMDVIERLVKHNKPVVGALAFRRGPPYFPCVFFRDTDYQLKFPKNLEPRTLRQVAAVGTGAICIRRDVFTLLEASKQPWPWFCYTYPEGSDTHPSEDMFFCRLCELAEIEMYCDFSLVTPHLTVGQVDDASWLMWLRDNPDGGDWKNMLLDDGRPLEEPKSGLRLPEIMTRLDV